MIVFADTSGLFAAVARNDARHADARPTLLTMSRRGHQLVTTSYVVLETIALIQSRVGLPAALEFERLLRPRLEVIWVDEPYHGRAIARLATIASRTVSLVDCASFVAMDERRITCAFAYDTDFERQGFQLIREPTDLDRDRR